MPLAIAACGLGELLVDDLLELVERLRAGERDAVDEEVRRAVGADLLAERHVLVDLVRPGMRRRGRALNFASSTPASLAHFS